MLTRLLLVAAALLLVVGLPFALRPPPEERASNAGADTLVIISAHNEAIRREFTGAFRRHYRATMGRNVDVDWRVPGGTSEIARYLDSEYAAVFQNYWVTRNGKSWSAAVAGAYANPAVLPGSDPSRDSDGESARRAFLGMRAGIGIDLFFGGGTYDFIQQARAGRLIDSGIVSSHPEWFSDAVIPQKVSGEPFYDPAGLWVGTAVSSFGICYNPESLKRLGVREMPGSWEALADPRLAGQVALADPTKSSSAAKAFEQIIQQKMQSAAKSLDDEAALAKGWLEGLTLIQKVGANARFFTDGAPKVPIDVSDGEAAAGMCIDFYGRFQSEATRLTDGSARLQYFTPRGGSSVTADPIGMLRGAPHPDVARAFMEFVVSPEGQKLWNFRVGTPGGPEKFALRRLPIRKDFYVPGNERFRSDPGVDPYAEAKFFDYHAAWTSPLFRVIAFAVRVMSIDTRDEQVAAWRALTKAGFPPQATARFGDLSVFEYAVCREKIAPALSSANKLLEVRLAKDLGDSFRAQYREATTLAEKGL